ncbi:hypothetical protein C1645_749326 [Glomus cerebriforme]|uniref:Uncharacterized protein n=1 Tax=Glomus cerebriforme TaxID=658196 RepID=A0A397TKV1_9GLOM|nr:hypothetical protein C1645_749326 [Glomus cerebriforme]
MNANRRSSNTNSHSSATSLSPSEQFLENADVSSQKSIYSEVPNNSPNQNFIHTLPSDLSNQNFTLTAEAFDSLDFNIYNPNLFLNDDILDNNLLMTIPSEKRNSQSFPKSKFTENSSSSLNAELGKFDFDWQNDTFFTNFFDTANEPRFDTLSDIKALENNSTDNDINSFTSVQETDIISNQSSLNQTPNSVATNDLGFLDPSSSTSIKNNNKRPYTNIMDEQSSLSVSIINKKPKFIQNQKNKLNINRRKSIPAVDTIVNSFNRPFMSQTDTITYNMTANTEIPVKVEKILPQSTIITSTLSSSNAILRVNRPEFFHQMNIRLSTLAQFIKQSFHQQTDYVDLLEHLYPLLKFECQQIQRLIDLTDFKSLNFPKNLGQYSENDIENDTVNFIPDHITDYKFPLKVQKDGNEGFRAVSALLNNNEQLHEELRVRVVLEMVNRIDRNRRIFEKHTEEISANGGNITTTSVYEGYFQKNTIELLSNFELSTNSPEYASYTWKIESLNTCINGTLIGVPQLCILANILKATIRIIYPDKENRYFNTPIKCKGNSKRMFHFLIYNPLYKLQFPIPPIERYYIAPLVRQSDIFFKVLIEESLTQPIQLQSQQLDLKVYDYHQ